MQTKEKKSHLRAQSAHLRLNKLCRRSNFFTKEMKTGSGPQFDSRLVDRISGRCGLSR